MSIFTLIFSFFGSFLFLYFLWNRLKEDYTSHQIFSLGFLVLIGLLGMGLVGKLFLAAVLARFGIVSSGAVFWLSFLGVMLGLILGITRIKLKFIETVEAVGVGLLFFVAAFFAGDVAQNLSAISLLAAVATLILIVTFYFFETKYKNFSWYKSGKVGFSGLAVLGIFFLVRALVALSFSFVLSFAGKFESVFSGITAFLFFLGVFNLARQK